MPKQRCLWLALASLLVLVSVRQSVLVEGCDLGPFYWSISGTVADRPLEDAVPWVSSTPEEQGMDSAFIEAAMVDVRRLQSINSLLVVRNGVLVWEEYFNGHNAARSYEIASVAKSFMSALVGIAIEQGYFEGVNQFVSELLPAAFEGLDASKQRMTLRELLTMQAGLVWEPMVPLDLVAMQHVVDDVLLQPFTSMRETPFNYSTGLVHLASAAIAETTGMTTCEFAWANLFEPLGIAPEVWATDANGVYTGGWFMYFTPRELARFGQLYLQGGEWEGQQILSAEWVRSSIARQVNFDPFSGYGYWWWVSSYWDSNTSITYEITSARGGGGQLIWIVPALDLIMVTTSDHAYQSSSQRFPAETFLQEVLIPAVGDGE